MAPAPWDSVPPTDQHFVLITGANSGVGLAICQRLIDDFLHHHPLTSHLILIPTTRSPSKSRDTVLALRRHLEKVSRTSRALRTRATKESDEYDYIWTDSFRRVHILSPQLDLCDIPGIYAFAERLVRGTVSNPPDGDGMSDALTDVRVPRLDAVVFNAGFGGWYGFDWLGMAKMVFTRGIITSLTWPDFKIGSVGDVVSGTTSRKAEKTGDQGGKGGEGEAALGSVFCSNVFGHYVLGHALLPLLARTPESPVRPGRIIWTSSIEATPEHFRLADLQGLEGSASYESSKRLTDILALTATLPSVRPFSAPYFRVPGRKPEEQAAANGSADETKRLQPRMYVTHPGVFVSTIFPLASFLVFWYRVALLLARWLGSPWHTTDGYTASVSAAWVALEAPEVLDESHAETKKWGSACDRFGRAAVKATEVPGWGWDGRVTRGWVDDGQGILSRKVGRRSNTEVLTEESRAEFEVAGAECWKEMERLRVEWEERLGVKAVGR
ncbi:related to 3-keto sterol reductase [Cephalotrichum gorgonifer]|uniref:Related to 3-keto sterol reductase n=1 Tax=Cephalotrichum gorgonifer TaxID=2041049 RepID=A0AAE8SXM3_9PEZI|nr:related to 3-keto sterol reductase [Cephalotrichum gorgonifer]